MLQEARGDVDSHPAYRRYHYAYGPLSVTDAAGTRFIGTDALGSPTDLTTTTGTVAAAHQYDAWGQYRNGTAPSAEEPKLGYTGHQYDPETGLVYARARYYDPEIGIFISRDTYEGELEDGPSLHRYAYAWSNPLRYWDSTGLCTEGEDEGCEIGVFQSIGAAIESATSDTTYAEARMKRMEANHQAKLEELAEEAENGPGAIKRAKEAIGRGVGSAVEWWNGTWVGRKLNGADDRAREYAREKGAQAFEGLPTGDNLSQTAQLEELGMGAPEHYADKEELGADIAEAAYEQGRDAGLTYVGGKVVQVAGGTRIVREGGEAIAQEERAVARAVRREAPGTGTHIGSSGDSLPGGKRNLINPSGRDDNCVAGVCAVVRNKLARNFEGSADDIESLFGSTARARGLSEAKAIEYIQNATGRSLSPRLVPFMSPGAPVGHYVLFAGNRHALYGRVLPNGTRFLYDAQTGLRLTWDEARTKWGRMRPYLVE